MKTRRSGRSRRLIIAALTIAVVTGGTLVVFKAKTISRSPPFQTDKVAHFAVSH